MRRGRWMAGLVLMCAAQGAATLSSQQTSAPALSAEQAAALPPPAATAVDFSRDIKPILQSACVRCHARGKSRGGFSMETRDALLEGGDSGAVVVPGKSADSFLIALVAAVDPDNVMPQKGSRLKAAQVGLLRAWIDQGASWDASVTFAKTPPRNLARRMPALPAAIATAPVVTGQIATGPVARAAVAKAPGAKVPRAKAPVAPIAHPVNRLLAAYLAEHRVTADRIVDDRRFARRVYFDVIGLPPSPRELRAFLADGRPDRRARLVRRLLADRVRYAEHWLSFWNDALRNDYRGPGYIDGGRRQITAWLYTSLVANLPYDQFVAQLVNPGGAAEGFTKGIIWRGVVNASQTPPMQAAQNVSQVFMGVNLKCASCHDSFINDWQLSDAYGLAGIYADAPLEMVECDRPTGRTAPTRFLYPDLGRIDTTGSRAERLAQLEQVITGDRNGRLSRTIVNRLWARFMGRGLVEPVDDMEQPAWHQDLLDWLAEDLVAHQYDLKHTIARILTSRAYQMEAVDLPERADAYVFRGPAIRRLSAEQFVDALSAVTGVWQEQALGEFDYIAARTLDFPEVMRVRAALTTADPLMVALGRPNREQVITTRSSAATTLQALELANGETLTRWLRLGAEQLVKEVPPDAPAAGPDALIARVYQRALGRGPSASELEIGRALVGQREGSTLRPDGVQDLLWAVAMLPEFQLIY